MRQTIRIILFKTQSLIALTLAVLATQRGTTEWVSVGATCGLAVWSVVSVILILISEDYLVRRLPWSLIAIILPAIFWLLISLALQLDISYAGLLTPFWISVGLICLALYDPVYPSFERFPSERASTDERARRCVSHGSCSDRPGSAQSPKRSRARLWEPSLDEEIGHTQRAKVDKPLRIAHQEPLMREPETRPISQEQIVAEVKSIYSGLVMVENKCIEVNQLQTENTGEKSDLTHQQWQALITLHRTLLHEHHDFFLASQHPSANAALKRLAAKYAMPARMWRHGIHSFLELLRHNLPQSRDYMLSFIYLAYSMMALLYETVPAFEETWIECLGDLSRYRMAIEEDDIRDREIWTGVSRNWYSKASEKSPTTGRLYHHLAILARPNALQQLFCYSKSLCVVVPFPSARESIITLFDPLLDPENSVNISVDAAFVRVQGILFTGKAHKDELSAWRSDFLGRFDGHIGRTGRRWLESGYFTGISLACSLLGFGEENNVLMRAISQSPKDGDGDLAEGLPETLPNESFKAALSFAVETWSIVFQRWGDINTLTCHHTMLVFLLHMLRFPAAMVHMEKKLPWKLITIMLNRLLDTTKYRPELEDPDSEDSFPGPENDSYRPLPEEYTLRGVVHAEAYLPKSMFPKEFDEDEKYIETSSMAADRVNRILWMGCKIARSKNWLIWDAGNNEFGTAMEYDVVVENIFPKDYDSDSEDAFAALSRPLWRVVDWAWNTKHSEHCPAGRLTNSDTESEVCLARRPGPPPTGKSIIEELNTYCEGPDSVCGRDSTGADFGRESFLGCLLKRAKSLLSATWNSSISSALFSTRSLEKAWCEDLVRITCSPTTTPFMCRF